MISDFWFAISAQRRKMQKRRYFWFSFVELEWKLQLWFSTAYIVYFLIFIFAFDFAKWKSENRFNFLIFNSKWEMKIGKLNLFLIFIFKLKTKNGNHWVISDFLFQIRKGNLNCGIVHAPSIKELSDSITERSYSIGQPSNLESALSV